MLGVDLVNLLNDLGTWGVRELVKGTGRLKKCGRSMSWSSTKGRFARWAWCEKVRLQDWSLSDKNCREPTHLPGSDNGFGVKSLGEHQVDPTHITDVSSRQ